MSIRLGLAAVLVATVGALAGCAGNVNATDGPAPAGPLDNVSGTLVVRADPSDRDLVQGVVADLQEEHPKVRVQVAYSSSSGSPDVVVSTDRQQLDRLRTAGSVGEASVVAQQVLTLAVAPGNPGHVATLTDLAHPGVTVAVCTASEPCGDTATTLLKRADVSPADVRRVPDSGHGLSAVTEGQVDAALVWASDVRGASGRSSVQHGVRTVQLAAGQQQNIRLIGLASRPVLVATASSGNRTAAAAFVQEMRGAQVQQLLRLDGYR